MKEALGLITVILAIIGHFPYIIDTIKRKTKPHVFTWLVWGIVTILVFIGQWQKGAGSGAWATGVTGLITLTIAILSIKNGTKDITKSDKLLFVVALLSIIPWFLAKDPTFSIIMLTFVDLLAFIPTVRKTIKDPTSETLFTYALNIFRHSLTIIAIANYNLATYLYPTYLLAINIIMTSIILKSRIKKYG